MIIPTTGRVLVEELDRDVSTESGIVLAGSGIKKENLSYGKVVLHKAPSDVFKIKLPKGTEVFYSRFSAMNIRDDKGKSYVVVPDMDIQAYQNDTK